MQIKREKMKQRICPICGKDIGVPFFINVYLNDSSVMPQPVCLDDIEKMRKEETQKELLKTCKEIWVDEIQESEQRTEEEKRKEIERINALEVNYKND